MVFRESEEKGYGFMAEPVPMAFIAVAAYSGPQLIPTGGQSFKLSPKFADKTKQKIRAILGIGLAHGHDSLVLRYCYPRTRTESLMVLLLSAFGCGAYGNPPAHMAELFKEMIVEFDGCFKKITFAILGMPVPLMYQMSLMFFHR